MLALLLLLPAVLPLLHPAAAGFPHRLDRSLRREWRFWHGRAPRRARSAQLLLLLLAIGSGALLLAGFGERLQAGARQRGDTESGLLELRINGHKVVAADWGHWDPIHRYLSRPDRRIIERELITSSIVRDGQHLRLMTLDGRPLYDSRSDLPGRPQSLDDFRLIERCLREQTDRLIRLPGPLRLRTWGFHCPLRQSAILGAATGVSGSGSLQPVNGWLLHFSTLERPSYNPAINHSFAALAGKLVRPSSPGRSAGLVRLSLHSQPLPFLDELPASPTAAATEQGSRSGGATLLLQPLPLGALPAELLLQVIAPWLLILAGLVSLPAALLLALRGLRHQQRLERRRLLHRLRHSRGLDPGSGLIGLEDLLERLEHPLHSRGSEGFQQLVLLELRLGSFSASLPDAATARQRALRHLVASLRQSPGQPPLALRSETQLVMARRTRNDHPPAEEERDLAHQLEAVEQRLSNQMQVRIQALIAPLAHGTDEALPARRQAGLAGLLGDLELLLSMGCDGQRVRLLSAQDLRRAASLRRQIASDFNCNRIAANLRDHRYRPEVVHQPGCQEPVYTELLFRLPEGLDCGLSIQDLILSLERNRTVHLIDALMLRKAISLTREVEGPRPLLATNLSATTLASLEHRSTILNLLRETSAEVRAHLALEVTETTVIADLEAWHGFLQELRSLGVKVVIDDFGTGYASLAYLFRFRADFIKIDRQFSRRLDDPDVEAMVAFLLHYERHHGTGIVMEGIESEAQLRHWQRRGIRRFQGYLFSPPGAPPAAAARAGRRSPPTRQGVSPARAADQPLTGPAPPPSDPDDPAAGSARSAAAIVAT